MDELGAPGAGKVIKNGMIKNLLSLTVFGHIHEPQTHSPPTHTLTLFPHLHTLPALHTLSSPLRWGAKRSPILLDGRRLGQCRSGVERSGAETGCLEKVNGLAVSCLPRTEGLGSLRG